MKKLLYIVPLLISAYAFSMDAPCSESVIEAFRNGTMTGDTITRCWKTLSSEQKDAFRSRVAEIREEVVSKLRQIVQEKQKDRTPFANDSLFLLGLAGKSTPDEKELGIQVHMLESGLSRAQIERIRGK